MFRKSMIVIIILLQVDLSTLEWLKSKNPYEFFEENIKKGKIFFLADFDMGIISIPGLDIINYEICYQRHAKIFIIDKTGDVIISNKHENLKIYANNFSKIYNRLILSYLENNLNIKCMENWGESFSDINSYLKKTSNSDTKSSNAGLYYGRNIPLEDWKFYIYIESCLKGKIREIKLNTCMILKSNGITRKVNIDIVEIYNREKVISSFSCMNGEVLETQK